MDLGNTTQTTQQTDKCQYKLYIFWQNNIEKYAFEIIQMLVNLLKQWVPIRCTTDFDVKSSNP